MFMTIPTPTYSIDTRRFRVIRELRDRGTIAATAKALNITPSAVSQQITSLSKEIGAPLLSPHGRGVRLTPQAHILINHAMVIDRQLELAHTELAAINEGKMGHITIGSFASIIPDLVAPTLSRLNEIRPLLQISIREIDTYTDTDSFFKSLDARDIDLALSVDFPDGPRWAHNRYTRVDLLNDPFLAAVAENHPLAGKETIELQDLAGQLWIMAPTLNPSREVTLMACSSVGFKPNIRHFIDNWISLLSLVANGAGVALVPRMATFGSAFPGVALRPLSGFRGLGRHIYAAVRAGSEKNPDIASALDVLREISGKLISLQNGNYYTSFVHDNYVNPNTQ